MELNELLTVMLANKVNQAGLPTLGAASASIGVLSKERFADAIGVPVGVVEGWVERGLIPTLKMGKHRLINIALLQESCREREFHDRGALYLSAAIAAVDEPNEAVRRKTSRRNVGRDA